MLEKSFAINFFLKTPRNKSNIRYVYLRITVDGVPKETSTKEKWDVTRWDQKTGRATGSKENARTLNTFLESIETKVKVYRTHMINKDVTITSQLLIDYISGHNVSKNKILEEFQAHNDEIFALIPKGEFAAGTHERYVTARSHVAEFIKFKYKKDDLEFRELNYEFIKDYDFYLRTVRSCNNNTTLKYIANFKKIVLRAVAKEIISGDPFKLFKAKKTKPNKKPLTREQLQLLEDREFSNQRLAVIRDIFVFQCYTGLAYIDVFQLKKTDVKTGIDGGLWIMTERQKTGSGTNVPLLPKALEIMNRYKDDPICQKRGTVLPVKSNQKMNEYLKEIAVLCDIDTSLNTHKARRTFGSTVTLNNGVPIHVVKEMLGHQSVKQTEEYALTEDNAVAKEMGILKQKLNSTNKNIPTENLHISALERIEKELQMLKDGRLDLSKLELLENEILRLKNADMFSA